MEKQQLKTMLFIEKNSCFEKPIKSHPKRRFIADCLYKLIDNERISEDIFALTMSIFDNFISKTTLKIPNDRYSQLIALSCYNLAKKLRTNTSINNENAQISLIFSNENYSDEEIFNTEEIICTTLDWDLTYVVPHDYLNILLKYFFTPDDRTQIYIHVQILLSIAICELNTLTILPSLLACGCIKAAIKGLSIKNLSQLDELILKTMHCNKTDLIRIQYQIEQFFQSCIQSITPSPRRRCLAPIETSPQQRTKVK